MTIILREAIILLYPSKSHTTNEIRESLNKFCGENNIAIVDIISLSDEYDYLMMRRLYQVIKYSNRVISLVTNRSILAAIPSLALWSALEATNSAKLIELTRNFLNEFKEGAGTADYQGFGNFRLLSHREAECISDWLSNMQYALMHDAANKGRQ